MKPLIKSATVYSTEIPVTPATLAGLLAEHRFTEIPADSAALASAGFVPVGEGDALLTEFAGGYAIRFRYDEKKIPGAVLAKETQRRIEDFTEKHGKPGKELRAQLKEQARDDLARVAFVKATAVTVYYHAESNTLIVPSTSQRLCDMVTSSLVNACGAIKASTPYVSAVRASLTTRLQNWLAQESGEYDDGDAFGPFHPCSDAALADDDKNKVTVKMSSLQTAQQGLTEAMTRGFTVRSIGLMDANGNQFRLGEDFKLKGISYAHGAPEDEDLFAAEAALEVAAVVSILAALTDLLEVKEEAAAAEE